MDFKLKAPFKPTGDQPQAIKALIEGIDQGLKHQVLLGVTGSGKTFTMANIIKAVKRPTLIISHNKTLAAQLYQEFRDFFPKNAVSYFVSYYDYYQPEAYLPQTDTYIEKETDINEEIDKLRLFATANLLTRKDTIIVASVSCIYNLGSPREYGKLALELKKGMRQSRESILKRLVDLQYVKDNSSFTRGKFRVRGESIDVFLPYEDTAIRIVAEERWIKKIYRLDPLNGIVLKELSSVVIYPTKHYIADSTNREEVFRQIRKDRNKRVKELKRQGKNLEAHRLTKRLNYDLEMIEEVGYVNGIENYSRYFERRKPGDPPFTLLDYFKESAGNKWLLFIDESHMTVPQIRGMYSGDRSRKQTLIDFGFRLPSALDNRPLRFTEFMQRIPHTIYTSATPAEWEISIAKENASQLRTKNQELRTKNVLSSKFIVHSGIVEQLIRPTGILDPEVIIRPTKGQVIDLAKEILVRKKRGERVLVTTLTKRNAEDLAQYFQARDDSLSVAYLHCDVATLERNDILDNLRFGKYDVLIGINLLREGLDLPEVSLVTILDADKEGFLRSETSLIQTMGRAARHIRGTVIMYADEMTGSMRRAIAEIKRRRNIQIEYNKKHRIMPKGIKKPIREKLIEKASKNKPAIFDFLDSKKRVEYRRLLAIDINQLTPYDLAKLIKRLERQMKEAASDLNFELAAEIRDKIKELCKTK